MNFNGKTIWITGASSGIGEALTYEFSKLGAKIIISARRTEELERVKANCKNPANITIQNLDLAKHDEVNDIANQVNVHDRRSFVPRIVLPLVLHRKI